MQAQQGSIVACAVKSLVSLQANDGVLNMIKTDCVIRKNRKQAVCLTVQNSFVLANRSRCGLVASINVDAQAGWGSEQGCNVAIRLMPGMNQSVDTELRQLQGNCIKL